VEFFCVSLHPVGKRQHIGHLKGITLFKMNRMQ
jgi:hypothetical protein